MELIRRIKIYFWSAVVCFAINSASFVFMPYASFIAEHSEGSKVLLFSGALFWFSLIAGSLFLFIANTCRREFIKTRLDGDYKMNAKIGIFTFFSNVPAVIFDVMMIPSFIAVLIAVINSFNVYITYIFISVFVLSFEMHCIFNGRIYKSTKFRRVKGR